MHLHEIVEEGFLSLEQEARDHRVAHRLPKARMRVTS
jgi:hypothetical protein